MFSGVLEEHRLADVKVIEAEVESFVGAVCSARSPCGGGSGEF